MHSLKQTITHLLVTASLLLSSHVNGAEQKLTIGYNVKPPFFYSEAGLPKGIIVERAKTICKLSGVTCVFEELPFTRIMAYLEWDRPNFVALGLSKTDERKVFSVFSDLIYQDLPPILVIRQSDASKFNIYSAFADMLKSKQFVFGAKTGNTYPIDVLLKEYNAARSESTQDTPGLLKMLEKGRFDYLLLYPEEYDWFTQITKHKVTTIRYADMPLGKGRYFLFSKSTPPSLIAKINDAIKNKQ